jgi:hypothetical protein
VHRTFQRWVHLGSFARLWAVLLEQCAGLGGVEWQGKAADGAMSETRSGGI